MICCSDIITGGIRGGAFCHGILEYLVENELKFDSICCVSGGMCQSLTLLTTQVAILEQLSFKMCIIT